MQRAHITILYKGVIDMKNKLHTKNTFINKDTEALKAAVTAKIQHLVSIEARKKV